MEHTDQSTYQYFHYFIIEGEFTVNIIDFLH